MSNNIARSILKIKESQKPKEEDPLKKAQEEQALYDLKSENDKRRHKNKIFIWSIYVLWIVAAVVLIVRMLHFILPDCYEWLSPEKLSTLDKFFFSGAIGGVLGKYGASVFK